MKPWPRKKVILACLSLVLVSLGLVFCYDRFSPITLDGKLKILVSDSDEQIRHRLFQYITPGMNESDCLKTIERRVDYSSFYGIQDSKNNGVLLPEGGRLGTHYSRIVFSFSQFSLVRENVYTNFAFGSDDKLIDIVPIRETVGL